MMFRWIISSKELIFKNCTNNIYTKSHRDYGIAMAFIILMRRTLRGAFLFY